MTTPDILAARKLENSGMTRSEAEAVVGLVRTATAPLATNASLKAMEKSILDAVAAKEKSILDAVAEKEKSILDAVAAKEKSILDTMAAGDESVLDSLQSREDLIRADMRAMESRLLWRVATLNLTSLGALVAILRLFPA